MARIKRTKRLITNFLRIKYLACRLHLCQNLSRHLPQGTYIPTGGIPYNFSGEVTHICSNKGCRIRFFFPEGSYGPRGRIPWIFFWWSYHLMYQWRRELRTMSPQGVAMYLEGLPLAKSLWTPTWWCNLVQRGHTPWGDSGRLQQNLCN